MSSTARAWAGGALLAAHLIAADGASAQYSGSYRDRYGEPVDVSLDDLVWSGSPYEGRAVRTRGRLEMDGLNEYSFRTPMGHQQVRLRPVSEVAMEWDQQARSWTGKEVQVVGVFAQSQATNASQPLFQLTFWEFTGPPEEIKGEIKADDISLESLVSNPGRKDGVMVRVLGQFRGKNLYGDLPSRSMKERQDWVIKDDSWAIWVTGRKPKGDGFDLDLDVKRDTAKWVEVYGKPTTRNGLTYLQAVRVLLAKAPTVAKAHPQAAPTPPPAPRPKRPPVVVFSMPLDGEPVAPDGHFTVQFSKDLDEKSLSGRVLLRYVGPRRPGDRDFVGLKVEYDGGRRALKVDPGDALLPGREIEVLLLKGILDLEGLELEPRRGTATEEVVDALRFRVKS